MKTSLILAIVLGSAQVASAQESGSTTVGRIVRAYPFAKPYIAGYLDGPAFLSWFLPRSEWNRLSPAERAAVVRYMPILVARAKQHPEKYLELEPSAPVVGTATVAARGMAEGSWLIGVGGIVGEGHDRTLSMDKTVVCGAQAPGCSGQSASAVIAAAGQNAAPQIAALPRRKTIARDPEIAYVAKLFADGTFQDVHGSGEAVDLLVGSNFYELSFDEKKRATQAAWNKTFRGRNPLGILFLKDYRTGKDVGKHTGLRGLTLY